MTLDRRSNSEVPPGWEQARLGDIADIAFSSVDKRTVEGEEPVRLCNYTDVYYKRRIVSTSDFMVATATPTEVSKWRLKKDDVLFTKDSETSTDIGIPSYVTENMPDVLCGYHLGRARPNPTFVDGEFLAHAMASQAVASEFSRIANGITRFGLTLAGVRSLRFALPPLPEQQVIAAVLDSIDKSIERTEAVITATEQLRVAVREELLTRGLPGWHSEQKKVPRFGTVPATWKVKQLCDVVSLRKKKVKPTSKDERRYVGLEHIERGGSLNGYAEAKDTVSNKTVFHAGDTLYGKLRPNLRKTLRVGFDGLCSTDILVFCSRPSAHSAYVGHLVRSWQFHIYAMRGITGTRMPRTSWNHLRHFTFPCPPLAEQEAIARTLDSIDNAIETSRRTREALTQLKVSTAEAFLTGQKRVPVEIGK